MLVRSHSIVCVFSVSIVLSCVYFSIIARACFCGVVTSNTTVQRRVRLVTTFSVLRVFSIFLWFGVKFLCDFGVEKQ